MCNKILLNDQNYVELRVESRQALYKLGTPSNPGFTDGNILDGLARALGVEITFSQDMEGSKYSGEFFRDSLGVILGLELPPDTEDVIKSLRSISQ